MTKTILTIAGSDTLAGGGLQSDLKTFEDYRLFGLTAITCIAVMKDNQFEIHDLPTNLLQDQLDTIKQEVDLSAIKLGLIHDVTALSIVKNFLQSFDGPIVLDPVMAFKETDHVYSQAYRAGLIQLFPFATIVTPNLKEAELLSQQKITALPEMKQAAQAIVQLGATAVVIKGGERLAGELAFDLFYDGNQFNLLSKPKLTKKTINGAGCTFASAIASNLVLGKNLETAIVDSKEFVYQSILNGITLKNGEGNVWYGKSVETEEQT